MNERIRRGLIFVTIVGCGTLLIIFDLPLLIILPLIITIGLVLLILLGAIPVAELKALGPSLLKRMRSKPGAGTRADQAVSKAPAGPAPPLRKRIPLRLKALFGKKPATPAPAGGGALHQKPAAMAGKKKGFSLHMKSLVSSVKALGTMLATRKKTDPDKLKKIDSMLDLAVSEKVDTSTPLLVKVLGKDNPFPATGAGLGGVTPPPSPSHREEDPFLSLSNDELESGLLDDLGDDDTPEPQPAAGTEAPAFSVQPTQDGGGISIGEPDMPLPPQSLSPPADDMIQENEPDLADLPALEGIESVDENLGELDNLSLDSVELDDEDDEEEQVSKSTSPVPDLPDDESHEPAPAALLFSPSPASAGPDSTKRQSDPSDMAAFAAVSAGDDDMLSSLAADIKNVKKKVDLSLLRELKDFRAPGKTLETELSDLYTSLNTATEKQKVRKPAQVKKQKAK